MSVTSAESSSFLPWETWATVMQDGDGAWELGEGGQLGILNTVFATFLNI